MICKICGAWYQREDMDLCHKCRAALDQLRIKDKDGFFLFLTGKAVAELEEFAGIPIKHLQELAQAEKDGRLSVSRFKPGDCVWVIERDEYGEEADVAGCMFLAEVLGFVIVSAYINEIKEAEETLSYHAQETAENYDTDLMVFPSEDVYQTKQQAEKALGKENENG